MSKFKIGDPVTIKDEYKKNSWYTTDVFYISRIFAPHEYEKRFSHELLQLYHPGKEVRIMHETKIELNLSASRELKLNELGI